MKCLWISILIMLCVPAARSQSRLYSNEFPLSDVRLLDGPFRHALDLNVDVLLR